MSKTISLEQLKALAWNLHRGIKDIEHKGFEFRVYEGHDPLSAAYRRAISEMALAASAIADLASQVIGHGDQLRELIAAADQLPASMLAH